MRSNSANYSAKQLALGWPATKVFFHFTHMQISQLYDFLKEEASGSCILDASELHLVPFQHSVGLFRGRCIDIFQNLLSNMLADIPIAWS